MSFKNLSVLIVVFFAALGVSSSQTRPDQTGKMVDLGGHALHLNCTGEGSPTVVVENGLGDFSFDWILVQSQVAKFTRVCTYDRAGYAWSDPGPRPRTFAQINLELHDALAKAGEKTPYLLVGHSYGGPVTRNFALLYRKDVAGLLLVDAAFEGERVDIGNKKTMRLGDGAEGRAIPLPHEDMAAPDKATEPDNLKAMLDSVKDQPLDPLYNVLPPKERALQTWAQLQWQMYVAEDSQREWSAEYFAKWLTTPQAGTLGSLPVLVLTRAEGGYHDGDSEVPAAQREAERKAGQAKLAVLSTNSRQTFVKSGHNMELEAPDEVVSAIRTLIDAVRKHHKL